MKTPLVFAAISGFLAVSPALAGERQISVSVGDLTCPSCSYIAASSMRAVPTVEIVDFREGSTWDAGIYTITFDDEAASPDMILAAIAANGYPAELLPDGGS